MNLMLLVALAGLMHATRSFSTAGEPGSSGTSLAFGYLLITGFFAGLIAKRVSLPKLTGYLMIGMVVGPSALGLVSRPMLESLSLVNGMAVAMIALTAGTELEVERIAPLARTVFSITTVAVLGTILLIAVTLFCARDLLPFLASMSIKEALTVSLLLGVVTVAQSPAVVVALRDELRADGPVARTAMAVVVLADLVVIFLFALCSTMTKAVFGHGAHVLHTLGVLAWEILGSLIAGGLVGLLLILYLRKVHGGTALFVLAITFVIAEVGGRLGFDPLLLALAAGALVRNGSDVADKLHDRLQVSSMPVYVLFFCVAGASLHLEALSVVWLPALLVVGVRAFGLLAGTRLATQLAEAPASVQRYAGFGLLPQAGLALALSMLFSRTFPEFGAQASALTLSVVGLNEMLAPIAYRWALTASGEVGREAERAPEPTDESLAELAAP